MAPAACLVCTGPVARSVAGVSPPSPASGVSQLFDQFADVFGGVLGVSAREFVLLAVCLGAVMLFCVALTGAVCWLALVVDG